MNTPTQFDEVVVDVKVPSAINEIECAIGDDAEIVAEVELLRARVQAARSWGS